MAPAKNGANAKNHTLNFPNRQKNHNPSQKQIEPRPARVPFDFPTRRTGQHITSNPPFLLLHQMAPARAAHRPGGRRASVSARRRRRPDARSPAPGAPPPRAPPGELAPFHTPNLVSIFAPFPFMPILDNRFEITYYIHLILILQFIYNI